MSDEEGQDDGASAGGRCCGVARTTWLAFSEDTSMHGLAHAVGRSALWRRLGWSVLIMGGLGMAVYNLTQTLQDFMDHPVSTKLSMEYDPYALFPAVTICNINRFKKSELEKVYDLQSSMARWTKEEMSIDLQVLSLDLELRKNYSEQELSSMGHSLKNMLIDCNYRGIPCTAEYDFKQFYDYKYGNCFTFNTYEAKQEVTDEDLFFQSRPGADSGLAIELDIDQEEYLPLTTTAGIVLAVHQPGEMAFPQDGGMAVGPGVSTSVGIKKVEISRAPPPFSQCMAIEGEDVQRIDMYAKVYGYKYTAKGCRKTCQQFMTYQQCGCCDMGLPCDHEMLRGTNSSKYIPLCIDMAAEEKDNATKECLQYIAEDIRNGDLMCDNDMYHHEVCHMPCEEVSYVVRINQVAWPSDAYKTEFVRKANASVKIMDKNFVYLGDPEDYFDYLSTSMLRLEVFYEQLNYERIESVPMYTWNRLLGDIGGQLGLYLGFSILTAVECLEFLGDLIAAMFCCARGQVEHEPTAKWAHPVKVGL